MKKFCLSYSTGKDSILALDMLRQQDYFPVCLITSVNDEMKRSWFHGVSLHLLEQAAENMDIPLIAVSNNIENYEERMESALKQAKKLGADYCCFGDIDIEQHREWDHKLSKKADLIPLLPLWQKKRRDIVEQFLTSGYTAIIKTISKKSGIPEYFLGRELDKTFINYLLEQNLDVCGENGEYHTLVVDGPIFTKRLKYQISGIHESLYAKSLIID